MARLAKIWTNEFDNKKEIRIDWDNDRHQSLQLVDGSPEEVIIKLKEMARLLERELEVGNLNS